MNARFLFILLIISVLMAFSQRHRKVGLSLSVVLTILLLWFAARPPTSKPSPPATSSASSAKSAIVEPTARLSDMHLDGDGAPWHLTGSVQNTSAVTLQSLSVHIERWDCPTSEAAQENCEVLWQGTRILRVNLAAGASVKLKEDFYSHDPVTRLLGVARDRFTVVDVN